MRNWGIALLAAAAALPLPAAPGGADVLVIVNERSLLSRRIGDYYVQKREVPLSRICRLNLPPEEEISRDAYTRNIQLPVETFLKRNAFEETILYMVTTLGVPLKIAGDDAGLQNTAASVDSELAALYGRMHSPGLPFAGPLSNPYYRALTQPVSHPRFPLYLVTRLAGYSFEDVKGLIDRSLAAKNEGTFVFDARADNNLPGNEWLRAAARALPRNRVLLDESAAVLYGQKNVIGFASWGSNDPARLKRHLGFSWLAGAIATEYVSTNARTFVRPPEAWTLGTWKDPASWFSGSPQTLTADLIAEGATGASGHVYEPYLELNPRPDYLFPAYFSGRTLAESYYISLPAISWMNVVVGDPLCRLR